jgi:hypothetical protein
LGTDIEVNAAGIGIPAFGISVRYQSILVPDWFLHRHFVHYCTGLT